MKLYISVAQPPLAGYINLDVSKVTVDLANLNNICEASECTELIANNVLRFMPYEQLPTVIHHLSTRLRHNGTLKLIFTDINSIIRAYNAAEMDEKLFNELMFGPGARSCFSYSHILNILSAVKLEIVSIELSKEQVIVVAKRP